MRLSKHSLPDDLIGHLPLQLHHQFQHFVVGLAGEEDLSGVEFVQRTCDGPHVQSKVILCSNNCVKKGEGGNIKEREGESAIVDLLISGAR